MLQRIRNRIVYQLFYTGMRSLSLPEDFIWVKEQVNKIMPKNKYLRFVCKIFILSPILVLGTIGAIVLAPFSMICLYFSLAISPLRIDMLDTVEGLLLDEVVKQQMEVSVNVAN